MPPRSEEQGWVVVRETAMQVPYDQMPYPYPMQQARPRWSGVEVGALVLALVLPVLAFIGFATGNSAVDRMRPDASLATTWYIITGILGLLGIIVAAILGTDRIGVRLAIAVPVAVPIGFFFAMLGENYGPQNWFFFFGKGIFMLFLVLYLVVAIVPFSLGSGRRGADAAVIGGLGLGLSLAGAAMYHLMTLPRQVAEAQAAYEMPAPAMVLVLLLLLGLARLRR